MTRGRRRRATGGAALLAGVAALLAAAPARAEFVVRYEPPPRAGFAVYRDELERQRFLESVSEELNRSLVLRPTVTLALGACGEATTRWSVATRVARVCYEFVEAAVALAGSTAESQPRAEQLFSGALTFALLAEVGRALVTLYRLPAERGAGPAGDEFAAITLAAAERDGDPSAAAALEFYAAALGAAAPRLEYLAAHGFDRRRLEDVACLLYGNAPANHARALASGLVPAARAPRCAEELLATAERWERQLRPHARPAAKPRP